MCVCVYLVDYDRRDNYACRHVEGNIVTESGRSFVFWGVECLGEDVGQYGSPREAWGVAFISQWERIIPVSWRVPPLGYAHISQSERAGHWPVILDTAQHQIRDMHISTCIKSVPQAPGTVIHRLWEHRLGRDATLRRESERAGGSNSANPPTHRRH